MKKQNTKKSNMSFILSVCLMITLIAALMIPTTIAWFTDQESAPGETVIGLGVVDIGINDNVTVTSSSAIRGINYVLPGDSLNFAIKLYNNGTVDSYILPQVNLSVMYGETDITSLFWDYLSFEETTTANIVEGTGNVIELPTTNDAENCVELNFKINISIDLPNYLSYGTKKYMINGNTSDIKFLFNTKVASIQKPNYNPVSNLRNDLMSIIDPAKVLRSFSLSNGELKENDKLVETSYSADISANGDGSVKAFVVEEDTGTTLVIVGSGEIVTNLNDWGSADSILEGTEYINKVTHVQISEGVENIPDRAFYGCWNLKTATIATTVTEIGDYAFVATSIEEVSFIEGSEIEVLGGCMFMDTPLKGIKIPASVTSIGSAFFNTYNLEYISVEPGNPVYHSANNCVIETATSKLVVGCKSSVIPDYVIIIGDMAFSTYPENLIIPKSVTTFEGELDCYVNSHNCNLFLEHSNLNEIVKLSDYYYDDGRFTYYTYSDSYKAPTTQSLTTPDGTVVFTKQIGYWHYNANGEPEIW